MKLIIAGTRPPDYILKNVKKYAEWMILLKRLVLSIGTISYLKTTARDGWVIIDHYAFTEIVSGNAFGPDHLGEIIASLFYIPVKKFPADWKTHGKAAGMIRNREMAEHADELYLVWDGKSSGSRNMKEEMIKREKPVHELVIKDWTLGVK